MEVKKMPDKLLELKNDLVFQELFGKQKNSEITAHFLSLILGKEIYNIDLDVNKRMLGNRENSKTGRLDIRAKFNNGEDCNIELQVAEYEHMDQRMLDYWARLYSGQLEKGDDYTKLKRTILIAIVNFNIKEFINEEYHTKWQIREERNKELILTNDVEIHIIEIEKAIKSLKENKQDKIAQWMSFFDNPNST